MSHMPDSQSKRDREQGIVRDERGQDQPKDKERAQHSSSQKAQKESAESQPQSPGQPAQGE
jgi:hypothetical protein